jgi:cysteine synthase A
MMSVERRKLQAQLPSAFIPRRFNNPANSETHRKTTAEEMWRDTDGEAAALTGQGRRGGTATGVGGALKEKKASVRVVAVEPCDSAALSGNAPGPRKTQGIGAGFLYATVAYDSGIDPEAA